MEPIEWLTIGLVIFAGAQVAIQVRSERARVAAREADAAAAADEALQFVWAEYFRLHGLGTHLGKFDLVELSVLGVLRPGIVVPSDPVRLMEALSKLSRESAALGGLFITAGHEVERAIGIFTGSVLALARLAPMEGGPERVQWLREHHADALEPWELSIRKGVKDLSDLLLDAADHGPHGGGGELRFRESMNSDLGTGFLRGAAGSSAKSMDRKDTQGGG